MNKEQAMQAKLDAAEVECFDESDPNHVVHRGRVVSYLHEPSVVVFDDEEFRPVTWLARLTRPSTHRPCSECGLYPDGNRS